MDNSWCKTGSSPTGIDKLLCETSENLPVGIKCIPNAFQNPDQELEETPENTPRNEEDLVQKSSCLDKLTRHNAKEVEIHSPAVCQQTEINTESIPCHQSKTSENSLLPCHSSVDQTSMKTKEQVQDQWQDDCMYSMVQVVESVSATSGQKSHSNSSNSEDDSSGSDSSSDESSSSSDDSWDMSIRHKDIELDEEIAALKKADPPKVKGEMLLQELPPVNELNILLPDDCVLEVIGKVAHIMPDHSVIIQSYPDKPALDCETVLFFSRDTAVGKVEETFGPVPSPFYIIRFNSDDHLQSKGVELNKEVSYAPQVLDFTSFVFVSELRSIRGSDASWCNDQEPPPSCIDYSDDEQEREARRRRKNDGEESENKHKKPVCTEARNGQRGKRHPRERGHWHNESARSNVTNMPDPSQSGWQSAVNGMSRRPPEYSRLPLQPDLFTCFRGLPPEPLDCSQPPNGPCHLFPLPTRPQNHPPPYAWGPQHSFMHPPMFGYPPPPPPPPP